MICTFLKSIVAIALAFIVFIGCEDKNKDKPTALPEKPAIQVVEEEAVVERSDNEEGVIFSTKDLDWGEDGATWISPEKYPLKIISYDGKGTDDNDRHLKKLPDYKGFEIIISTTYGERDNDSYDLSIVKEKIINWADSTVNLDIAPNWSEVYNEENNYRRKTFKIYKDYTIEINTKEKLENNEIQKYTKYYRINDNGEFYEVSKPAN